jgi:hypothetical protein
MKEKLTMKTKEIQKNEWPKFFDNFSSKHQGWSVTLEIFGTELGAQVQERELALVGIVDEWDEIHGNRIVIMFGEKPDDHVTHSIEGATEVSLEQTEGGEDVALAIKSADGVMALLRFLSPMLPEMLHIQRNRNSRQPGDGGLSCQPRVYSDTNVRFKGTE